MNSKVKTKFDSYPEAAISQLLIIREIIFDIAKDESLGEVVESLKWGEPSYETKQGSAVRFDWKAKSPGTISIYFNCKTRLVETFKEIYPDSFHYVGNREIVFQVSQSLPIQELKVCISMALRYHKIKHLPLLGA